MDALRSTANGGVFNIPKTEPHTVPFKDGLLVHLIMNQTIGLMGYIGPLTLTLALVCSSISPIVR